MPKVKYITKPEPSVPVNYLRALFAAYRKANGLNSEIVAERLRCAPETVRWQWAKPPKTWKYEKPLSRGRDGKNGSRTKSTMLIVAERKDYGNV